MTAEYRGGPLDGQLVPEDHQLRDRLLYDWPQRLHLYCRAGADYEHAGSQVKRPKEWTLWSDGRVIGTANDVTVRLDDGREL